MKKTITIIVFIFTTVLSFSQELKTADLLRYAEQSFEEFDFYSSIYYYGIYVKKDSSNLKVYDKYATASRLGFDYAKAEKLYKYIFIHDDKNIYSESLYWYAQMLKSNGKYNEAKINFNKYWGSHQTQQTYYVRKSLLEISACDSAIKYEKNPQPYKISHIDGNINTTYNDYGALQINDSTLLFSSSRPINSNYAGSLAYAGDLTEIYKSQNALKSWKKAEEFNNTTINNKIDHNANVVIEPVSKRLYFTRCKKSNSNKLTYEIYFSDFKDGKWLDAIRLSNKVNLAGYTATQPAIASSINGDILYFVSNRPGGMGGLDIWYTVVSKDGNCSEPVNLGKSINTDDDEITPFYDNQTQTLYFSSNGRKSIGNFDVYKSEGSFSKWKEPINMGSPINTSYNDLYFTIFKEDSLGYLTSNRPGSLFIKSETCCNDIYKWEMMKPKKQDTIRKDTIKKEIAKLDTVKIKKEIVVITRDTIKTTIKKEITDLLPLTLYFHNDEPDKKTMNTKTNKSYEETYENYISLIDKYKNQYSFGMKGDEKADTEKDIENFFNDYVIKGHSKLELFVQLLLKDLQSGKSATITLKGYCSPLTTNKYNKNLAKRRISSVVNYLYSYNNGVFWKYMNGKAPYGNRIVFKEEPIGEDAAPKDVSDNPRDKRNSVYSRKASMERKIQILYYDSK